MDGPALGSAAGVPGSHRWPAPGVGTMSGAMPPASAQALVESLEDGIVDVNAVVAGDAASPTQDLSPAVPGSPEPPD